MLHAYYTKLGILKNLSLENSLNVTMSHCPKQCILALPNLHKNNMKDGLALFSFSLNTRKLYPLPSVAKTIS